MLVLLYAAMYPQARTTAKLLGNLLRLTSRLVGEENGFRAVICRFFSEDRAGRAIGHHRILTSYVHFWEGGGRVFETRKPCNSPNAAKSNNQHHQQPQYSQQQYHQHNHNNPNPPSSLPQNVYEVTFGYFWNNNHNTLSNSNTNSYHNTKPPSSPPHNLLGSNFWKLCEWGLQYTFYND